MMNLPKDSFKLPGKDWEWEDIWHVEKTPDQTDPDGWQYALDFNYNFHGTKGIFDSVRRKKWVRVCRQKLENNSGSK